MGTFENAYNTIRSVLTPTIQNPTNTNPLLSNSDHQSEKETIRRKELEHNSNGLTGAVDPNDNSPSTLADQYDYVSITTVTTLVTDNSNSSGKEYNFPEEIFCLIFENMFITDLIRCSAVCQKWNRIILDKRYFWQDIEARFHLLRKQTLDKLIRQRIREFRIGDFQRNSYALYDTIDLLINTSNVSYIQRLSIDNCCFTHRTADHLAYAIQLMPKLKRIEFIDNGFPSHEHLKTIMDAILSSTTTTHILFYQTETRRSLLSGYSDNIFLPINQYIPDVVTNRVSYLRMARPPDPSYPAAYMNAPKKLRAFKDNHGSMLGAFRKFPCLTQLLLDIRVLKRGGQGLLYDAIKSCPQLVTLLVTNNAAVPQPTTCLFNDTLQLLEKGDVHHPRQCHYDRPLQQRNVTNNSNNSTKNDLNKKTVSKTSPSKIISTLSNQRHQQQQSSNQGLRQLIIADKKIQLGPDVGSSLFKHSHTSLELLYLQCQLETNQCYKIFDQEITSYNWSMLREVYLSFNPETDPSTTTTASKTSMSTIRPRPVKSHDKSALANFFSRCHGLEAITIDNSSCQTNKEDDDITNLDYRDPYSNILIVDDQVLKSIALNCPRLRYLRVLDDGCFHTIQGILHFATIGGFYLTDLELSMVKESILPVVIKLRSLKHFDLRSSSSTGTNKREKTAPDDSKKEDEKKKHDESGITETYRMLETSSDMKSLTGDIKAVKLLLDTRWEDASFRYFQQYFHKYTFPV
ncbi:hypothetical protein BDA99DRAFT_600707 [Phascolomyces articulosus]|uniref:F-box domain-containing protein n=1 Tax=Phascolomyces articulosus TaxID=60185 RepID=A0AAD5KP88_9FUNG|nr:hypothetical protein BDA99DRAFT_600707 [Phascolomyces articulosus]